jgi:hypothetical protein
MLNIREVQVTEYYSEYLRLTYLNALKIRQFENDNETYNIIRRTAEEKVADTLAGRKDLLRLAVLCIRIDKKGSRQVWSSDLLQR